MFLWPLLLKADPTGQRVEPPFIFLALLPLVVVIVVAEYSRGGIDSKTLAILGVLTAVNSGLRALGAGMAGLETVFFLLVLAGRAFGPAFGFVFGVVSLFGSALLTAGVGPWLPYQMLAAGWVGLGAGLLPRRVRGRREIVLLAGYSIVAAYFYGAAMNMVGWPYLLGIAVPGHEGGLSVVPGDPLIDNLKRFGVYTLLTSTGGWDTGRAITTSVAVALLGPGLLAVLRRASRRAQVDVSPAALESRAESPVTFGAGGPHCD